MARIYVIPIVALLHLVFVVSTSTATTILWDQSGGSINSGATLSSNFYPGLDAVTSDDFVLSEDSVVTIAFWSGEIKNEFNTIDSFTHVLGFWIRFFLDDPVSFPQSIPGILVYEQYIPISMIDYSYAGTSRVYDVFYYQALLPTHFAADGNVVYWFSAQADVSSKYDRTDPSNEDGWYGFLSASSLSDNLSSSVLLGFSDPYFSGRDSSFALAGNGSASVPEPSTLLLLGSGLVGLAGRWRGKREA